MQEKFLKRSNFKLILTDLENPSFSVEGEHKIYKSDAGVRHCVGCFCCWLKTPGECLCKDGSAAFAKDFGRCSQLIIISRCVYGDVSPFIKKMQDRALPFALPFFLIKENEMHHKLRYSDAFEISALFYGENITDEEKSTARELINRNALNYGAKVKDILFFKDAKEIEGKAL